MRRVATGYRPDIQGLRALAIVLAVGFHLYPDVLPGGYVGVDVFFVISGFLITGHLASRFAKTGRVRLLEFYGRRARRLLPAGVLVLVVTWVGSRLLLPVTQRPAAAEQIRASALYIQNWVLAKNSVDYLQQNAAPSPVQHYWSLSVEEQFYLIWPLLFVAAVVAATVLARRAAVPGRVGRLARRTGLRVAAVFAACIVGASLWYSVHETTADKAAAYFVTPTRLWELGAGGLLALCYPMVSRWIGRAGMLSWIGLAMVVGSAVMLSGGSAFPGWVALVPIVGSMLLIAAGAEQSPWSTAVVFTRRPVVFIGDISYSIYLWHWPLITLYVAYQGGSIGIIDGPVIAAASVVLAWLTKVWVEDPFRKARWIAPHPGRSLATVAVAVIPIALTTSFLLQQPTTAPQEVADSAHPGAHALAAQPIAQHKSKDRRHSSSLSNDDRDASSTSDTATAPQSPDPTGDSLATVVPPLAQAPKDYPLANTRECKATADQTKVVSCTRGDTTNPVKTIALVGDSFAAEWSSALIEVAKQDHWKIVTVTHDSCPWTAAMLTSQGKPYQACQQWGKNALAFLRDTVKPDVVLVSYHPGPRVNGEDNAKASERKLADGMVTYWRKLASDGTFIVGIHPTPDPEVNAPDCLSSRTGSIEKCSVPRSAAVDSNTALSQAVADLGSQHAAEINLNQYICPGTRCAPVVGDVVVYRDEKHLTKTYSLTLAPYLGSELRAVLP